jgi:murein DD-endopeptidase MepM/ murein hydrolase activator NlpD
MAGGLFICLVALTSVLVHYGVLLKKAEEMEDLKTENRRLEEKVSLIDELSRKLKEYEIYVEKINVILGVGEVGGGMETRPGEGRPKKQWGDIGVASYSEGKSPLIRYHGSEKPKEWPLTRRGFITRGFTDEPTFHPGVDIAVPENTAVRTTASGVVSELGWDNDYGNYIEVQHGGGYTTIYGHNSRLIVSRGQWVKKGDIIAFSGSTGRSTAPHLHYEVRRRGIAVDPQPYLLDYRRGNGFEG